MSTIIHGTLRTPDLLRAFADEYERVAAPLDGKARELVTDSRTSAKEIDEDPEHPGNNQCGTELVAELIDALNKHAPEGQYFGAHAGDGSDFGYWETEKGEDG